MSLIDSNFWWKQDVYKILNGAQEQQRSDQQESTNRASQSKPQTSNTNQSTTQSNKMNKSAPSTIKLEKKASTPEKKKCC